MKGLLLDTCVALWYFEGSDNLAPRVQSALRDPTSEVFFSDVSLFEVVVKHQIGKLRLSRKPSLLIPQLIKAHGFETLPITSSDICRLEDLPLHHRDPFDRLLVAQSRNNNLRLISPDPLIRAYDIDVFW